MTWYFGAYVLAAAVVVVIGIDKLRPDFVRKMDELIGHINDTSLRNISGELHELQKYLIHRDKSVELKEQLLAILKRAAQKEPTKTVNLDGKFIYEEGLKDGASELARYILEEIKETSNG